MIGIEDIRIEYYTDLGTYGPGNLETWNIGSSEYRDLLACENRDLKEYRDMCVWKKKGIW